MSKPHVSGESEVLSREIIDATTTKMLSFALVGDWQSWARFLAEDATFDNSQLKEPVVGRDAISEFAKTFPQIENVIEWKVIEGKRIAFAWRERQKMKNGMWSGWYRGFSTFAFNGKGEVQEYEGMFNLLSIASALDQVE